MDHGAGPSGNDFKSEKKVKKRNYLKRLNSFEDDIEYVDKTDKSDQKGQNCRRGKSAEGKKEKKTWEELKMSNSIEVRYSEILNPKKSAEEAFQVNLAEQLENYLQSFVRGDIRTNFNSAALVIQGSSTIYSQKVEYLYNLASNLHEILTKNSRKDDNKKNPRERGHRQAKTLDPFCSTEIKAGKNLSCLRRKNVVKVTKKSSKKTAEKKHAFVPVDLLPLECEEKGDVFYDTRGESVGNRNDYALNKCRITESGWLLLPTVSPDNIKETEGSKSASDNSLDSPADEGYPASSDCPSTPSTAPPSQDLPSSQAASSQQTDEGLGSMTSTPSEGGLSQPVGPSQDIPMEDDDDDGAPDADMENIPLEDFPTDEELAAVASKGPRRSMRNVLQQVQIQQADRGRQNCPKEDLFAVRRPIEKNNTVCYPPGMRRKEAKTPAVYPASVYCARTFFSVDNKLKKNDMFSLQVKAFANNSKFLNQIKCYKEAIKAAKTKRKAGGGGAVTADEEEEVEVDDAQEPAEEEEDHSFAANPGPIDDDFDSDHEDPFGAMGGENSSGKDKKGTNEATEDDDDMDDGFEFEGREFDRIADEQMALFRDDLQTPQQSVEMTERVRKWEKVLKPFLEDISQREKFDINLYGSEILDSFEESNRRQTVLFRKFCEGKEKYQVHRYFLALLPLANVGNVSIANEESDDGQGKDIAITLLSRRMHHMELEDFGHNEGQHN